MRRAGLLTLPLAIALLLAGCHEQAPVPGPDDPPTGAPPGVGRPDTSAPDPAPSLEGDDTAAVNLRPIAPDALPSLLAEARGKAVLIDFWATWCGPCREQFPHTVELSRRHAEDLVVYAVSMDETDEQTRSRVAKFYADHGPGHVQTLISAQGGSDAAYEGFDIRGGALPHYKIYDREGQLIRTFGGDVDEPIQLEAIDSAVAQAIGA
jgi:thiol-disulfide isomerase/thioredoxin